MVMVLKVYDLDDCEREGLIRKIPPSLGKARGSISAAERWIDEAEKNLKNGVFNSSVMASYLAMFHSSRSILFFDGFREKSHYCIARYLEKYAKNGLLEEKWIDILDHQREIRHNSQYDISFINTETEAEDSLETSKLFLARMKELLNRISTH
jgi:uncharacterized protein (UPF0332 family)